MKLLSLLLIISCFSCNPVKQIAKHKKQYEAAKALFPCECQDYNTLIYPQPYDPMYSDTSFARLPSIDWNGELNSVIRWNLDSLTSGGGLTLVDSSGTTSVNPSDTLITSTLNLWQL